MKTMNRIAIEVLAGAFALAGSATAGEAPPEEAPPEIDVIWWGSSSTGMLKRGITRVLDANGILKVNYGKHGTRLRVDHVSQALEKGDKKLYENTLSRMRMYAKKKKYDFGIFQLSGGIFWHPESGTHAEKIVDEICVAIKESGTTPVIFTHWSRREPDRMREIAIAAARKHGGRVAFTNSAAAEVMAEKGDDYIGKGEGHAWPKGIYLWTCCMYASLTGKSPVGLPAPKGALVDESGLPVDESSQVKGNPKEAKATSAKDKFTRADLLYLQTKAWEIYQKYNPLIEAPEGEEKKEEAKP